MRLPSRSLTANNIFFQKWILIVVMFIFSISGCISAQNTPPRVSFPENQIQEASNVIVNFETLWLSEQSHRNPSSQAELATGEYLDRLGYANSNIQNEIEWLVTDEAKLESLKLIEYDEQRFKAEACVITSGRRIRPNGDFIGLFSNVRVCGIYVFIKTDNKWKLLGFLNNMDPRNYEHTPDWLKEIIGDIPPE